MGADWIGIVVEYDDDLDYETIKQRVQDLTDEQIRDAVGNAMGCELEELYDEAPDDVALRLLGDVFADSGTLWRYIGQLVIKGDPYLVAGGSSWGDTPEGYDGLHFLDWTQVLMPNYSGG